MKGPGGRGARTTAAEERALTTRGAGADESKPDNEAIRLQPRQLTWSIFSINRIELKSPTPTTDPRLRPSSSAKVASAYAY